ncbi:MAG: carboxy terminal-processing peptidase, partial [bacterium]|nr:carboxy terminal-processing peptidase [bacterium]
DLDYALPNDEVRKASHTDYKLVDSTLLARLRDLSATRIRESDGFDRLLKRIEMYEEQKEEKQVSLNRDEFMKRRQELDAQREEEEQILESQMPKKEVFKMDFYNEEILNIAKDYVEAVNKLNLAQAG